MKISLALGPRQALSRQTAWGCLTTNLALPGFGSLVAGRRAGYLQAALALGGMALTCGFGIHFMIWAAANWSSLHGDEVDPFDALARMWVGMRWAVAGMGLFALGWVWALGTSFQIVREATLSEDRATPPRLE